MDIYGLLDDGVFLQVGLGLCWVRLQVPSSAVASRSQELWASVL